MVYVYMNLTDMELRTVLEYRCKQETDPEKLKDLYSKLIPLYEAAVTAKKMDNCGLSKVDSVWVQRAGLFEQLEELEQRGEELKTLLATMTEEDEET